MKTSQEAARSRRRGGTDENKYRWSSLGARRRHDDHGSAANAVPDANPLEVRGIVHALVALRHGNPWRVPGSRCAARRSGVSEAHAASSAAINSARRCGGAFGQPCAATDRRGSGRATRDRPCTDLVAWARRSLLVILPGPSRVPGPEAMPAPAGERRSVYPRPER